MPKTSTLHLYALALGSNRALSSKRTPARLLEEAIEQLGDLGEIAATGPVMATPPLGPSLRLFANSAILIESPLWPGAMLAAIKEIERQLGRRRHRRWGARSIDIDIILWSGGRWRSRTLHVPHPAFRARNFVLTPLSAVAPHWRDPVSGLAVRHLRARLRKAAPLRRPRG